LVLTPERQQMILDYLHKQGFARLQDLVLLTEASESTIRRDLNELEQQKKLKRVHGGAALPERKVEEPTVAQKEVKHEQEKQAIATFAAGLVKAGDSIFLDGGTTTSRMIPHLPKDVLVVTNGMNTAMSLLEHGIKTILIGGTLKPKTLTVVGRGAINSLQMYRFDKCFLGINGIDLHRGLTTPDPEEAYVKATALQLSDDRFVVVDSSKFGEVSFSHVCDAKDVQIITDSDLPEEEQVKWKSVTAIEVVQS
jgi:DeoR family fructose operon transcriptional repressor